MHCKAIREQISDNSPTITRSSDCTRWSFQKVWKLYGIGHPSSAPSRKSIEHTFHVAAPHCDVFGILLLKLGTCICADQLRERCLSFHQILVLTCAARWIHPRCTWSRNDTGSSKSTCFCNCAHIFDIFWVSPSIFMSSTNRKHRHPHPVTFSPPSSIRASSDRLSHNGSAKWLTVKIALMWNHWIVNWGPILRFSCIR